VGEIYATLKGKYSLAMDFETKNTLKSRCRVRAGGVVALHGEYVCRCFLNARSLRERIPVYPIWQVCDGYD
jgi:hypothetical protein